MQKVFYLTDEQLDAIEEWRGNHDCSCRYNNQESKSCTSGDISLIFTPYSIGTAIQAKCFCGKKIDLGIDDL